MIILDLAANISARWCKRLGLAFAAWASLLKEESNMRLFFSAFAVITLIAGIIVYLGVPVVAA